MISDEDKKDPFELINGLQPSAQVDLYQSLDDILEDLKKTLNDIPPPKCSKKEISANWEFVKSIKKEDILEFVSIINKLPSSAIHEKVKEIEQLALRLDIAQTHEFEEGDNMKVMKRNE
jgi:hypothetical protein